MTDEKERQSLPNLLEVDSFDKAPQAPLSTKKYVLREVFSPTEHTCTPRLRSAKQTPRSPFSDDDSEFPVSSPRDPSVVSSRSPRVCSKKYCKRCAYREQYQKTIRGSTPQIPRGSPPSTLRPTAPEFSLLTPGKGGSFLSKEFDATDEDGNALSPCQEELRPLSNSDFPVLSGDVEAPDQGNEAQEDLALPEEFRSSNVSDDVEAPEQGNEEKEDLAPSGASSGESAVSSSDIPVLPDGVEAPDHGTEAQENLSSSREHGTEAQEAPSSVSARNEAKENLAVPVTSVAYRTLTDFGKNVLCVRVTGIEYGLIAVAMLLLSILAARNGLTGGIMRLCMAVSIAGVVLRILRSFRQAKAAVS